MRGRKRQRKKNAKRWMIESRFIGKVRVLSFSDWRQCADFTEASKRALEMYIRATAEPVPGRGPEPIDIDRLNKRLRETIGVTVRELK